MKSSESWRLLLERHKDACFLAEQKSKKIFYANAKFEEIIGSTDEFIGKNYLDLYAEQKYSVSNYGTAEWDMKEPITQEFFSKTMNSGFKCDFFIIPNTEVICCITKMLGESEESNYSFETALSECISVLSKDKVERNSRLLEILGNYYDADKTYLYRIDRSGMKIHCEHYWRKEESITVTEELSVAIETKKILDWLETRNEAGILDTAREHENLSETSLEAEILNAFHLNNIVSAVIEDNDGVSIAVLTMTNRRKMSVDFRLLQAVKMFIEKDITKSESEFTVEQLNDRDILTGFCNRLAYANEIDKIADNPPKNLGIFLANVNGLKRINTEYGYAKGDSYIKKASEIMKSFFDVTFYRIAGDEFVAFFPESDKDEFESKIFALQKELKEKYNYHFAIGHAWEGGRYDFGHMISEADTLMYINKQEYYHNTKVSHSDITDSTLSDLLSYLEDEEFMIYLQPQVRLKDASLYGAEALIRRFDKKNQKMVFPDQFISLYEQKSVIRHVDMFVIRSVCELMSQWQKNGIEIPISVNLSRVTLQEYGIVDTIVEICDKYQVPHNLLVIEVTERVGLIENSVASALIKAFKDNGFNISLDDFGCAYSNIVTLAQIEVDEVKIDKSLVDDLTTNNKNHILVKNVLTMCNELDGASTLAEGIEDEHQARLLYELGCHLGQGYFYSRPIPASEFYEKYIKDREKK